MKILQLTSILFVLFYSAVSMALPTTTTPSTTSTSPRSGSFLGTAIRIERPPTSDSDHSSPSSTLAMINPTPPPSQETSISAKDGLSDMNSDIFALH